MKHTIFLILTLFVYSVLRGNAEDLAFDKNSKNMFFYQPPFDVSLFAGNAGSQKAARAENNKGIALMLNGLLGYGIGSFVQGDVAGGVTGLLGELGSLGLIIFGMIPEEKEVYHPEYSGYYPRPAYYTTEYFYPNIMFMYIGLGTFLAVRIFELIRPFTYARKLSVSVVPAFNNEGRPMLTSAACFRY